MDLIKHIKPLTGKSDWPTWKRNIRDLLDYYEGVLDFVDGKLVKLESLAEGSTNTQIKTHKECADCYRKANSYAKSIITSAITDEVYQKIMGKETASEAWEALKQQFEATSNDQLVEICTEFLFSVGSQVTMSTHIAQLRSLWSELNNGLQIKGENALPDLILLCKTLQILPSNFETFKSSWMLLTKDENKTFDELVVQLCMFEINFTKSDKNDKVVLEALVAKVRNKNQYNKTLGYKRKPKKDDVCNYCKKSGHRVKDCKQWIADEKTSKNTAKDNAKSNAVASVAFMSIYAEACTVEEESSAWWIDNGATRHVTNCSHYFLDFQ
ncbi:zinc knuckle protein [Lasius niger]|uniref:Zinc knuckle protein n=1 Tax=Lasius niger TaxID=67767 RepID=A0A0J7MV37_LASNI|nr:zinc knuckle protein [Lasius niger]